MNAANLAAHYPTPFFAYDAAIIRARLTELNDAFKGQNVSLHYAIKANDLRQIIQLAADADFGACLVSSGEMQRALKGGMNASKMLMNGVGKSEADIRFALENNIGQLNIESLPELDVVAGIASSMGKRVDICLRINPEIIAGGHSHIITARRTDKFGLLVEDLPAARAAIARLPALNWVGFSCHLGSQIEGVEQLAAGYKFMAELFMQERATQPQFNRLDLGGGFGVSYEGASYSRPADFAALIKKETAALQAAGILIQLEPGRFVVAEAGQLITRVLYVKNSGDAPNTTRFLVVDAAMNNLIRPALYGAYHPITLARESNAAKTPATIVGPICESGDFFARDRDMPSDIMAGDILSIGFAGAYGMVMASQYNARDRLAEVVLDGESHSLARRALTADELDDLTLVL